MPVLLVVLFVVVPIVELAVIIQVGQAIGVLPTVALLIVDSVVGSWLLRREGRAAWARFRGALDAARIPSNEVVDGALVLFGGALMLTPGFLSDVLGLLLILPPTRALVNRAIRSRVRGAFGLAGSVGLRVGRRSPDATRRRADDADPLEVEVVNVERTGPDERQSS